MSISRKLRPLFDRIYSGTEAAVLGLQSWSIGRKYASTLEPLPDLRRLYRTEIRPYWKQFRVRVPAMFWFHQLCNPYKTYSPKYIPEDMWFYRIIPYYSNLILGKAMQDKCQLNLVFPDLRRPETVVKCIAGVYYDDALNLLTREEALARCIGAGRILAKPSVGSGGGKNVRFYDSDQLTIPEVEDIFRQYGKNFIIQKKLVQHPELSTLNPRSVNTIRAITFLFHGQVYLLTAVLRVGGGPNEMDNLSQGGYQCTIRRDGTLEKYAVTNRDGRQAFVDTAPTGVPFEGFAVPGYDKVIAATRTAAARMGHFKIIGWDIAVDPDGEPVLIEYNIAPAQNQESDGPTFGDLTDQVLEEVFGRRK